MTVRLNQDPDRTNRTMGLDSSGATGRFGSLPASHDSFDPPFGRYSSVSSGTENVRRRSKVRLGRKHVFPGPKAHFRLLFFRVVFPDPPPIDSSHPNFSPSTSLSVAPSIEWASSRIHGSAVALDEAAHQSAAYVSS